jgi:hypothetical protein
MLERFFRCVDRHRVVVISTLNSVILFTTVVVAAFGTDRSSAPAAHAEGDHTPSSTAVEPPAPAVTGELPSEQPSFQMAPERHEDQQTSRETLKTPHRKVTVTRRRTRDK